MTAEPELQEAIRAERRARAALAEGVAGAQEALQDAIALVDRLAFGSPPPPSMARLFLAPGAITPWHQDRFGFWHRDWSGQQFPCELPAIMLNRRRTVSFWANSRKSEELACLKLPEHVKTYGEAMDFVDARLRAIADA